MVKVVPLFKPFKTIFYFKFFKPGKVLFRSIKVWIDLKFVWMHLNSNSVQTVSTTTMHCSSPPAAPSPCFKRTRARAERWAPLARAHQP
jgi:hypothetical protein